MNLPIKVRIPEETHPEQQNRESTPQELYAQPRDEMFRSLATKKDNSIPHNPLEAIEIAMSQVKPNDVFPTNLLLNRVHKVVLATESTKYLQGPNGDKNQYMGVVAFGSDIAYKNRVITTRPFRGTKHILEGNEIRLNTYVAMFPTVTWTKMFRASVGRLYSAYYPSVIEVHFKKLNMKDYRLLYLCEVEWNQEENTFIRKTIHFKANGYSEKWC